MKSKITCWTFILIFSVLLLNFAAAGNVGMTAATGMVVIDPEQQTVEAVDADNNEMNIETDLDIVVTSEPIVYEESAVQAELYDTEVVELSSAGDVYVDLDSEYLASQECMTLCEENDVEIMVSYQETGSVNVLADDCKALCEEQNIVLEKSFEELVAEKKELADAGIQVADAVQTVVLEADEDYVTVNDKKLTIDEDFSMKIVAMPSGVSTVEPTRIEVTKNSDENMFVLKENDVEAYTYYDIELKNNMLYLKDDWSVIKLDVMPSTAVILVVQGLGFLEKEADVEILIKGDNLVYESSTVKDSKVFWLFPKQMEVRGNVDATTGNLEIIKPWWAIFAAE